jgi:citrate synthase
MKIHLTAGEAADFLNISKATLYAYVSRGLVRSEYGGVNQRSRIYHRIDLERLKQRKRIRQQPTAEISSALHWGSPLLDSGLTLITNGQVFYRGEEAIALASTRTFLEVATWFWTAGWETPTTKPPRQRLKLDNGEPIFLYHQALLQAAMSEPLGYDFSAAQLAETGTHVLTLFLQILTQKIDPKLRQTAGELQKAWCPGKT